MKTFKEFQEAVGFGGKITPDNNPKKGAEKLAAGMPKGKKSPGMPGIKNPNNRPPNMAGAKEKAGVRAKGGALVPTTRPKKPTRNMVKPKSDTMEVRNKKSLEKGAKTFDKRKSGIKSGIKSALGGDIIGAKPRQGESRGEKVARLSDQKKSRADFGKKVASGAKRELRDVFRLPKGNAQVGGTMGLQGPKSRSSGSGAQ